jgi:hypothetical protein
MTTYTPMGEHHSKVHKINLNSKVRGDDYAKGKSPLKLFRRYPQIIIHTKRKRKIDRTENARSVERDFAAELDDIGHEYNL